MADELDTTTNDGDTLDLDGAEEKEVDDIDPSSIINEPEEVEDSAVEEVEDPEKEDSDPFGFGEAGGILDENGEFVPAGDDEDEPEDEISEDLF